MVETPAMLNHNRGLWGYSGTAADGALLTVQSSGSGGPCAAIVVAELVTLGARRIIRVGTCRSEKMVPGTISSPDTVEGRDGTSRALSGAQTLHPDPSLVMDLPRGSVASVDVFEDLDGAVDLESAAVLAAAARAGVPAAVVLVVTDLDDERRQASELAAGQAAARAFGL